MPVPPNHNVNENKSLRLQSKLIRRMKILCTEGFYMSFQMAELFVLAHTHIYYVRFYHIIDYEFEICHQVEWPGCACPSPSGRKPPPLKIDQSRARTSPS